MNNSRPWLKTRLNDSADALMALEILAHWKRLRSASRHISRAILLYHALLTGDASRLNEYFPFLSVAVPQIGGQVAPVRRSPGADADLDVSYVDKDESEDLDDFLSDFF